MEKLKTLYGNQAAFALDEAESKKLIDYLKTCSNPIEALDSIFNCCGEEGEE